jgi:hypothetical protein
MKRLSLAVAVTFAVLILTSEFATAQRGRGSAGPPPTSERGRMPDRSSRPTRESTGSGSVNREHQTKSNMAVSDRLDKNTHLAIQLQGMFPPGTDLQQASSGFKNLGQFVAAAHVSKNLGIPFDQLKTKTTGDSSVSLGKAIQELRPEANAKSEEKKAEQQAREEIRQAEAAQKNEQRQARESGKKEE